MAETRRLPEPLAVHWEWQTQAACRGMDSSAFYHPTDERNAARESRIAAAKASIRGGSISALGFIRQCPDIAGIARRAVPLVRPRRGRPIFRMVLELVTRVQGSE